MRIETLAVHTSHEVDAATGAVAPPIHLSTTFAREPDGTAPQGYLYSRFANPNRDALERCLAALEGNGRCSLRIRFCRHDGSVSGPVPGDHVIAPTDAYHGTTRILRDLLGHGGWKRPSSI